MTVQKIGLNKFVLIVDDEKILRDAIQYDFEKKGFTVLTAAHGDEAIDVLRMNHVDLVVSDIQMPVCDGICLIKKMRIMESPFPLFLFMSGFSSYTQQEVESLGALTLISKPIDRKEMFRIVEEALTHN